MLAPGLDDAARATAALDRVARALAAEGRLTAWRDERYAVVPSFGAPPLFLLERAAARYFGVHTYAVHVNGLVRRDEDVGTWIARRSPTKAIDPGLLDNLVGGGIAAGQEIATTVVKEAWEEAGIAESLARQARQRERWTSAASSRMACSARRSSSTICGCPPLSFRPARMARSWGIASSACPRPPG